MSTRRAVSVPSNGYLEKEVRQRGRCTSCLCISWKIFSGIFSHLMLITIVIGYCFLGMESFHRLEVQNEIHVKGGIVLIRQNLTNYLWNYTQTQPVLNESAWIINATKKLEEFETNIVHSMQLLGWDGNEDVNKLRWTKIGALFYSIIVITTIGYGHIAPKTQAGKIATIFYAICGIPLMLLCLSNIGDIMASSFRFIYWRICCFVCTREPKRRRTRRAELQRSLSQPSRIASARPSIRRSVRVSQRTADSGIDSFCEPHLAHAYSDTELRYAVNERDNFESKRHSAHNRSHRFSRHRNREGFRQDRHTVERDRNVDRMPRRSGAEVDARYQIPKIRTGSVRTGRSQSVARGETQHQQQQQQQQKRGVDVSSRHVDQTMTLPSSFRRNKQKQNENRARSVDPHIFATKGEAPVLCNKYAIDELNRASHQSDQRKHRARSMPRPDHRYNDLYSMSREQSPVNIPKRLQPNERHRYLAPPLPPEIDEDEFIEMETPVRRVKRREKAVLPPSPRIMSPMGFAVNRQARLQQYDEESMYDDDWIDFHSDMPVRARPVPLWLCVFLVIGYIIAGAFYFSETENWGYLDSVYFCFITLTTIGFGDFVPAQGANVTVQIEPFFGIPMTVEDKQIASCSLYLLFGIALLAMSFNLVQEEVIASVKNVARQLGILKEEDESDY